MSSETLAEQLKLGVTRLTPETYNGVLWPKLVHALDIIFRVDEGESIPLSYEEIYSVVYKCVCFQLGQQVYTDLITNIVARLNQCLEHLRVGYKEQNVRGCFQLMWDAVKRYDTALRGIVPIFNYLNRFYVEAKLHCSLEKMLIRTFVDHFILVDPVPALFQLAQERSMLCSPDIQMNLVLTVYRFQPDLAEQWPRLFQRFIPSLTPTTVGHISQLAEEAQVMQASYIQQGFSRDERPRKREPDEPVEVSFQPAPCGTFR